MSDVRLLGAETESAVPRPAGESSLARARYPSWPRVLGRPRRRVENPRGLLPLVSSVFQVVALVVVLYELPLFRAAGELLHDSSWGLGVPLAENGVDLELGPIVRVDATGVSLDGRRMATREELDADRGVIAPLVSDLETMHRNWAILHPRDPFPGTVLIAADGELAYRDVWRVVESATAAEYTNTSFVVRVETEGDRVPLETRAFSAEMRAPAWE
jgi:hypothetical protein